MFNTNYCFSKNFHCGNVKDDIVIPVRNANIV